MLGAHAPSVRRSCAGFDRFETDAKSVRLQLATPAHKLVSPSHLVLTQPSGDPVRWYLTE